LEVVSDVEAARNVDEGHAFASRAQSRVDPYIRIVWVRKTICRRDRFAGVLHQSGVLRMQKRPLALAEQRKARLVHRRRANRPGVADVDLLNALVGQITKSRQVRSARLKSCERFR